MEFYLKKINELIKSKNIDKEQLAAQIGVKRATFYNYLNGSTKMPVSVLTDIAKALGVPVSYFFGESGGNNGVGNVVINGDVKATNGGRIQQVIAHNHELEIEVERLRAELEGCRELLKAKDEIIAVLRERGK